MFYLIFKKYDNGPAHPVGFVESWLYIDLCHHRPNPLLRQHGNTTMKTVAQNPADDSLNSLARALRTQSEMRKRWLYILPAVFVTYSLAYLDRTNYGFGAAAGLAQTLNISSSRSALLGALFFFGYFLFQI